MAAPRSDAPAAAFVVGDEVQRWPEDAVEVGRVVGAWGIKGGLKVQAHAATPEALFSSKRWYLAAPASPLRDGASVAGGRPNSVSTTQFPRLLRIASAREHGDGIVAFVHELADRTQAESLIGARVHVPRSSFPTPGIDEYYWVDLLGLVVFNRAGDNFGEVVALHETGPHCVLRLSSLNADGQPRMIPFVAAYVDAVDLAQRRINVDWPADY